MKGHRVRTAFKLLFLISTISSFLFSAKIDTKIVDGNMTVYQNLLKKLDQDKNITEEVSLEKTLLHELLTLKEHTLPSSNKITLAKDTDAYRNLFLYYLDDIENITSFQKNLHESRRKIEVIEAEIKEMGQNDSRLLSYELQDAYYHKKIRFYQDMVDRISHEMQQLTKTMKYSLKDLNFDHKKLKNDFATVQKTVLSYREKIEKLQIEKEQAKLVNDKDKTAKIDTELKKQNPAYKNEIKVLFSARYLLFSSYVKENNNKAFALEKDLCKMGIHYRILTEDQVNIYLVPLLLSLEKEYMGQLKTLEGAAVEDIRDMFSKGWDFVNQPMFTINETPISIFKLFTSLLLFAVGFFVGDVYKRKIQNLNIGKRSLTMATRTIMANIGYYVILLIAFFMVLNVLGIKLSSLALVAGALSVGMGFGLKSIVSNLVSGLILMFERSVKIGDFVEINGELRGYITDIRMRSTTINTNDNIDVIVPNQSFIENNVINWTMRDNLRRFSIPFGVKYGTDPQKVIDIITKAVLESEYKNEIHDTADKRTRVIMTGMGDSSVDFELLLWIEGAKMRRPRRTKSEFLIIIYNTLYANNIEIPFPQRDLHIRTNEAGLCITKDNLSEHLLKEKKK